MIYDILVNPHTEKVVEVISQERLENKWAEIISMHCSPHDVWTVYHNWKYITMLRDKRVVPGAYTFDAVTPNLKEQFIGSKIYKLNPGIYSFTNIHFKKIVIEIDKEGRRLIRNHRKYWKSYLVPNFFNEEQWEYLGKYHKEKYRQLFCKGKTFPVDQPHDKTVGESREVVKQKQKELYKKFRRDLKDIIGKDYFNQTYRMNCWNWGSGDISDFVPLRIDYKVKNGDSFSLDWLSEGTKLIALDRNTQIKPKYHKVITRERVPV